MEKYNLTEKDIMLYIIDHRTDDFPLDKTLDQFYKEVRDWCDLNAQYGK